MYYHVWFVTKYRKTILEGEIEKFVKNILAEGIERHNYKVLETNKDHLHMLVEAKDKADLEPHTFVWGMSGIFGQDATIREK